MQTIVRIHYGSHLYGTNHAGSDVDYKSVHIPNHGDILMQRVAASIKQPSRSKAEGERNNANDVDDESFALHRFFELCAKGETMALDMLFAPDRSRTFTHPVWAEIIQNRHRLITKKSAAFVGYCRTQANKYGIKGSRVAAAKAAYEFFSHMESLHSTTAKVGTFQTYLNALILDNPDHMDYVPSGPTPENPAPEFTHFMCCNKQVPLSATIKLAREIFERIYKGYGDRALLAEKSEGVDWKALSHAVRVGEEALELLSTGHITLPLVNREHIKAIRLGYLSYPEVAAEIESLLVRVEEAEKTSTLPEKADKQWIDEFVYQQYRKAVIDTARWRAV